MSELIFTGTISEIKPVRNGEGKNGEWANVEFEVTESDPQNPMYPQVALFDYFKSGDHVKYAKEFCNYYKEGDEVEIEFNLKKTVYQKKDGSGEGAFYKTSAWKVTKAKGITTQESQDTAPIGEGVEPDDLPY